MRFPVALIFLSLLTFPLRAMTVGEIPALVSQKNHDVKAADHEVEAADHKIGSAWGNLAPKVELKSSYTRLNKDIEIDIEPQRIEKKILDVIVGIDIDPPPIKVQDKNILNAHVLATQPIYTGGRISAGIDAARAKKDEAISDKKQILDQKIVEALERYFQRVQAHEIVAVLQQIQKNLDRLEKISQSLVTAGVAAKFSTLQIRVAKADLVSKLTEANAKETLVSLAFKSSVGMDMTTPVSFDSKLTKVPLQLGLDVFKTQSLQRRVEFQLIDAKLKQVQALKDAQTGEMLPTVYAFGKRELMPDQLTALQPLWAVGVGVDVPITAGLKSFPERGHAEELRNKLEDLKQKAQIEIPLQVESNYVSCTSSADALRSLQEAIDMAREAMRLAEVRFNAASGSAVEVLKAATDLETLEIKKWTLLEQYNRALIQLYLSSGAIQDYLAAYEQNKGKV